VEGIILAANAGEHAEEPAHMLAEVGRIPGSGGLAAGDVEPARPTGPTGRRPAQALEWPSIPQVVPAARSAIIAALSTIGPGAHTYL
jgi:hypothetical protein